MWGGELPPQLLLCRPPSRQGWKHAKQCIYIALKALPWWKKGRAGFWVGRRGQGSLRPSLAHLREWSSDLALDPLGSHHMRIPRPHPRLPIRTQ